jgi:hypothetical protein
MLVEWEVRHPRPWASEHSVHVGVDPAPSLLRLLTPSPGPARGRERLLVGDLPLVSIPPLDDCGGVLRGVARSARCAATSTVVGMTAEEFKRLVVFRGCARFGRVAVAGRPLKGAGGLAPFLTRSLVVSGRIALPHEDASAVKRSLEPRSLPISKRSLVLVVKRAARSGPVQQEATPWQEHRQ